MINKRKIIICIMVLIIVGICFINPIKKEMYLIEFKKNVEKILFEKYDIIDSVIISGKYNLDVNLNMDSEFSLIDFSEQKNIINNIFKELNSIYISYKEKVVKIDQNINNSHGIIKFNTDTYFYNIDFVSAKIYKDGDTTIEYKEKDYVMDQIKLKIFKFNLNLKKQENLYTYLYGIDDIEIYKYLLKLDSDNTFLQEIAYQYLLKLSNNDSYSDSIFEYKTELLNYKDANSLFEKITEAERKRQEEYYSIPRIGMTKQQVLNTTWGQPESKIEDKPNTGMRLDKDGKESFFYKRGTTKIMISFKNGTVESFFVTKKGDVMAKEVYSIEGY